MRSSNLKSPIWRKTVSLLALGVSCTLFSASGAESNAAPVLKENSIEIAGKTITMNPNGSMVCNNQKGERLFHAEMPYCWVVKKGEAIWPWRNKQLDKEKTKLVRDGSKYSWELWFKDENLPSFCGIRQSLEVLPSGELKYHYEYTFPKQTGDYVFKTWIPFIYMKEPVWKGEKVTVENGSVELGKDMKKTDGYITKKDQILKWVFAADKPEKRFSIAVDGKLSRQLNVQFRNGLIQLSAPPRKSKDGEFFLDLR